MASRARLALTRTARTRLLPASRRSASAAHGSKPKKGGEMLWAGGSLAVFGPLCFWLLGPNAPGKHEHAHDEHGESDHHRALYKNPSREPKWTDEDEKQDRQARGESDDEEGDSSSEEGGDSEGSSDQGEGGEGDDDAEGGDDAKDKPKPQQVRSNAPVSNQTPRRSDPDKMGDMAKHMSQSGGANPKAFLEEFRQKKEAGETTGEAVSKGENKDQVKS